MKAFPDLLIYTLVHDDLSLNWHSTVVIQVNIFQKELMVKIYSKSLVRAIGKVLLMKFS